MGFASSIQSRASEISHIYCSSQRRWTLTLVFYHPPSEVSQRERVPPSGRVLYSSTPGKPSNQNQTNKRSCLPWSKVQSIIAVALTFVSSQTVAPGTALLLLCFCSCECDKLVYMLPRCPEPCELVFLPAVLQPFWLQNDTMQAGLNSFRLPKSIVYMRIWKCH